MWCIMSRDRTYPFFEEDTGHLRLVTGGCRQIVGRFDGHCMWVWCKATQQEEPLSLDFLYECSEKMRDKRKP